MKFYLLINEITPSGKESETLKAFKSAALATNTDLVVVDPKSFNPKVIEEVTEEDFFFRCATGIEAEIIEWYFLSKKPKNIFRIRTEYIVGHIINPSFVFNNKVPTPKTLFTFPSDEIEARKIIEEFSSFPLIVRENSTSGGEGIRKVNSFDELVTLAKKLRKNGKTFIIREYIEHDLYGRLIVLGDKVIAAKRNLIPENDFRSNNGQAVNYEFSEEVKKISVEATHLRGSNFGGVDVIFSKADGRPYITEVNNPCSFISTQEVTGIDIALEIIKFLKGI